MSEENKELRPDWRWRISRRLMQVACWPMPALRRVVYCRFLNLILAPLTALYHVMLDVKGSDWALLVNHKELHDSIFTATLVTTATVYFLRAVIPEQSQASSSAYAQGVLSRFISTVGAIVVVKARRFREARRRLQGGMNVFKEITKPEDQISVIGNAIIEFTQNSYGLKEDQIDITIIKNFQNDEWDYFYKYQQSWNHQPAEELVSSKSSAASCLESGEAIFHPDKFVASLRKLYRLSKRDLKRNGSIYVHPIVFDEGAQRTRFIVSIVTYGKLLCPADEEQAIDATKLIFREFCKRFEIELCLHTIKEEF